MPEEKNRKAVYNPLADSKWIEKNRDHANYLRDRSKARNFIKKKATSDDLLELKKLIEETKDEK